MYGRAIKISIIDFSYFYVENVVLFFSDYSDLVKCFFFCTSGISDPKLLIR